jgi:hypothetical protein
VHPSSVDQNWCTKRLLLALEVGQLLEFIGSFSILPLATRGHGYIERVECVELRESLLHDHDPAFATVEDAGNEETQQRWGGWRWEEQERPNVAGASHLQAGFPGSKILYLLDSWQIY